jgi:hypothetical protein
MPLPSRRSFVALLAALSLPGCVMSTVMPGVIETPQIQARAVQFLGGANGGPATMRVELVGYNPNSFAVYAANLRAELSVQGRSVGTVDAAFSQVMPARRPLVILVDVNVSRVGAGPMAIGVPGAPGGVGVAGAPDAPGVYSGGSAPMGWAPMAIPFRVDGSVSFRSRYGDVLAPFAFQGAVQSTVFATWR